MGFDPKNAINAAKDIAAHAIEKSADIVEDAGHIVKGDIAGGASAIVEDATSIATHIAYVTAVAVTDDGLRRSA